MAQPAAATWTRSQAVWCLGVHAAAVGLLLGLPWHLNEDLSWMAVAVPVSQNSLVALWASTSRRSAHVKFLAIVFAMGLTWFEMILLVRVSPSDPVAAGWAAIFFVQSAFIVLAVNVAKRVQTRLSGQHDRRQYRYSFQTLFAWLTIAAVLMALEREGPRSWNWATAGAGWEYLGAVPVLGTYHGLYAVIFLATVVRGPLAARSVLLAALLVGLLAMTQPTVARIFLKDAGGLTARTALLSASTQLAVCYCTALFLMARSTGTQQSGSQEAMREGTAEGREEKTQRKFRVKRVSRG